MPETPPLSLRDYPWEQRYATSDIRDHGRPVEIAERASPLREIDGTPLAPARRPSQDGIEDDARDALRPAFAERVRFAMLRLAPLLPGGERAALKTTPIEPWPHQRFVARRLLETYHHDRQASRQSGQQQPPRRGSSPAPRAGSETGHG